ncbi:hypothetical protein VNO77_44650 [Canavalia gladiata]|uniref:Uncharacterized protein n=1 Tax=Canavalia gladiata TaxID=3824 RepID=A0AAN9PNZ0_CANGL
MVVQLAFRTAMRLMLGQATIGRILWRLQEDSRNTCMVTFRVAVKERAWLGGSSPLKVDVRESEDSISLNQNLSTPILGQNSEFSLRKGFLPFHHHRGSATLGKWLKYMRLHHLPFLVKHEVDPKQIGHLELDVATFATESVRLQVALYQTQDRKWASLIPLGLVDSRAGLCFEVVGKETTTFFSLGHHLLNEATIKV